MTIKKHTNLDMKALQFFPILLDSLTLFKMFCVRLSEQTNFLSWLDPISAKLQIFLHLLQPQSSSPIFNKIMRQLSWVKVPNLLIFCKHYFACLFYFKISIQDFNFNYWYFFNRTNFVEPNKLFFWKFKSSLEVQRPKEKF